MKNFDDIFSRKVKDAFENYNADHLAEEGWNAYVSKHGKSRRRTLLIPLWARAASIIVLVTAGVLFINRLSHREGSGTLGRVAQETRGKQADSVLNKVDSAATLPGISATKPSTTAETTESTDATPEITGANAVKITEAPKKTGATSETNRAKNLITAQTPALSNQGRASEATVAQADHDRKTGSEKTGSRTDVSTKPVLAESLNPEESLSTKTRIAAGKSVALDIPDNPVEIRLAYNTATRLSLEPKKPLRDYLVLPREKMATTILTGFSGMMASVDNATSISQGVSIGFYVEQQLTRRISVRPGLAMARHNYAMESMPGGSMAFDYSAPELDGMSAATTSYDAEIDIVSMEVPVNLVFSLWKRPRSNLFVTTGASTVIYLSQQMSGSFNNTYTRTTVDSYSGNVSYETMTTSMQIESEQEILNRVDLLGLANFSAGYSLPFGKTTHLLFEPFVQLPIKDLTSMNLRIRYGGLSMKIQF